MGSEIFWRRGKGWRFFGLGARVEREGKAEAKRRGWT